MPVSADTASQIGSLVSAIGNIFGGVQQQNSAQWQQAAQVNVLNYLRQMTGDSQQSSNALMDFLRPLLGDQATAASQERYGSNLLGQTQDRNTAAYNDLNTRFYNNDTSQVPGFDAAQQNLQNRAGSADPTSQILQQLIAGGGWTPDGSYGQDRAKEMIGGQNETQQTLKDVSSSLLSNRGANPLDSFQDRAIDTQNAGGMNGTLDALLKLGLTSAGTPQSSQSNSLASAGQSQLDANGQTATGAQAEKAGLAGILGGGNNAASDYLTQRGQQITSQDPLLPFDTAVSLARNQAGTSAANAATNMRRQAMARGGGPGATVANGLQNQGLADFQNQALQNEGTAVGDAMKNQQGLQLQQFQNGAGMLNSGQTQANQRLGTYSDLTNALEGNATKRLGVGGDLLSSSGQLENTKAGQGLSAINNVAGQANQNIGTMGQLGLGSGQLDLSRLAEGGNLANSYNNSVSQGQQSLAALLGLDNSRMQSGISGYNDTLKTQAGIDQNSLANILAQSNQANTRNNDYFNQLNNTNSTNINAANTAQAGVNSSNNNLASLIQSMLGYQSSLSTGQAGMFKTPDGNFFKDVGK